MQKELAFESLALEVEILGINPFGFEGGNSAICDGRDLPWLQEGEGASVWDEWGVTYRDVVILDVANRHLTSYNLTSHDLASALNYAELKRLLRDAARKRSAPLDVDTGRR